MLTPTGNWRENTYRLILFSIEKDRKAHDLVGGGSLDVKGSRLPMGGCNVRYYCHAVCFF